jgi:hypothetical protein
MTLAGRSKEKKASVEAGAQKKSNSQFTHAVKRKG